MNDLNLNEKSYSNKPSDFSFSDLVDIPELQQLVNYPKS
jgi:hypothetical protein